MAAGAPTTTTCRPRMSGSYRPVPSRFRRDMSSSTDAHCANTTMPIRIANMMKRRVGKVEGVKSP